jgi:hypothetical protein
MAQTPEQLFVNEYLRPLAKTVRMLEIQIAQAVALIDQVTLPNDTTIIDDTRSEEGIADLTGSDVNDLKVMLQAILASYSTAGRQAAELLYPFRIVE